MFYAGCKLICVLCALPGFSLGSTHAWLQVYLPSAGWLPFDPTNNLVGGSSLIGVGVARHASLASPVRGTPGMGVRPTTWGWGWTYRSAVLQGWGRSPQAV